MLLAFMSLINTNCESRGGGGVLADRREVKRGKWTFPFASFQVLCAAFRVMAILTSALLNPLEA